MPIEIENEIRIFDQEEFHTLSRRVLRLAFDVHNDFGRFLDEELCKCELAIRCLVTLYRDAIIHCLGGLDWVCRPVEILSGSRTLGTQDMFILSDKSAFSISAIISKPAEYESHLTRFLHHTGINYIHWINLNHHNITFITLSNSSENLLSHLQSS